MSNQENDILKNRDYKHGWTSNIESESIGKGLNEDVVRYISQKTGNSNFAITRL